MSNSRDQYIHNSLEHMHAACMRDVALLLMTQVEDADDQFTMSRVNTEYSFNCTV